ncbi:hypothetical protein C8R43DRAFT_1105952 [Mycena crocata]|nr:hypothetical protein C8R43DRAFT_1105952 [Mycena crocata]
MSFNDTNDNEFGRDTTRTGYGTSANDRFDSSLNTAGGYGQDSYNTPSGYGKTGSNMNDSFGPSRRSNSLSGGVVGGNDRFGSNERSEFGRSELDSSRNEFNGDRNEFDSNTMGRSGKAPTGDKLKGGAEKLAGTMMGNAGMKERGQERKMGEFQNNDF